MESVQVLKLCIVERGGYFFELLFKQVEIEGKSCFIELWCGDGGSDNPIVSVERFNLAIGHNELMLCGKSIFYGNGKHYSSPINTNVFVVFKIDFFRQVVF